jgi:hypothetical protein
MSPRSRALAVYVPGSVLLAAGLLAVLTAPTIVGSHSCPCTTDPNGTVCPPCAPPAPAVNPLGPLLLLAAGVYTGAVYLVRRGSRSSPP